MDLLPALTALAHPGAILVDSESSLCSFSVQSEIVTAFSPPRHYGLLSVIEKILKEWSGDVLGWVAHPAIGKQLRSLEFFAATAPYAHPPIDPLLALGLQESDADDEATLRTRLNAFWSVAVPRYPKIHTWEQHAIAFLSNITIALLRDGVHPLSIGTLRDVITAQPLLPVIEKRFRDYTASEETRILSLAREMIFSCSGGTQSDRDLPSRCILTPSNRSRRSLRRSALAFEALLQRRALYPPKHGINHPFLLLVLHPLHGFPSLLPASSEIQAQHGATILSISDIASLRAIGGKNDICFLEQSTTLFLGPIHHASDAKRLSTLYAATTPRSDPSALDLTTLDEEHLYFLRREKKGRILLPDHTTTAFSRSKGVLS